MTLTLNECYYGLNNDERGINQNEKNIGEHAIAAKSIRKELKSKFKGVKFSVRSKSYSMGSSVDVSWENGPTQNEVSAIINKYQYGDFDGMTDSYNYRSDRPKTEGSAKHVFANRTIPNDQRDAMIRALCVKCGAEYNDSAPYNTRIHDQYADSIVNKIMSKHSVPVNKVIVGIARTDTDCGLIEDFYKPVYK